MMNQALSRSERGSKLTMTTSSIRRKAFQTCLVNEIRSFPVFIGSRRERKELPAIKIKKKRRDQTTDDDSQAFWHSENALVR